MFPKGVNTVTIKSLPVYSLRSVDYYTANSSLAISCKVCLYVFYFFIKFRKNVVLLLSRSVDYYTANSSLAVSCKVCLYVFYFFIKFRKNVVLLSTMHSGSGKYHESKKGMRIITTSSLTDAPFQTCNLKY